MRSYQRRYDRLLQPQKASRAGQELPEGFQARHEAQQPVAGHDGCVIQSFETWIDQMLTLSLPLPCIQSILKRTRSAQTGS
jgi:hypothetical protein